MTETHNQRGRDCNRNAAGYRPGDDWLHSNDYFDWKWWRFARAQDGCWKHIQFADAIYRKIGLGLYWKVRTLRPPRNARDQPVSGRRGTGHDIGYWFDGSSLRFEEQGVICD